MQLAPFTQPTRDEEDTIKAIVRHEYGSPDVLELGAVTDHGSDGSAEYV